MSSPCRYFSQFLTGRKLVIGCHSFEEYLCPKFETIFILKEEVAKTWKVDKLVKNTTCEQTLGVRVFLLDNYGGEWLGRHVISKFILYEMQDEPIEFLKYAHFTSVFLIHHFSQNSLLQYFDILSQSNELQFFPKNTRTIFHWNRSCIVVEEMVQGFRIAWAQREPEKYPDIQFPDFPLVVDKGEGSHWLE